MTLVGNAREILSEDLNDWPPLTAAYKRLFDELSLPAYQVRTVFDHYVVHQGVAHTSKATIILRVDVDAGFHLSYPLALQLHRRGLTASHYFLTDESRYYNIWMSEIPQRIAKLNQEVGLHSDHLYQQITTGVDGVQRIRDDVKRLALLSQVPVYGMMYHGHPAMSVYGCNVELYDNIAPEDLGLTYHDGLASVYRDPSKGVGQPRCHARVIDFMGLSSSWGWNYLSRYPLSYVRKHARKGEVLCIDFHTHNAFEYWRDWPIFYDERKREQESFLLFQKKRFLILSRLYGLPVMLRVVEVLGVKRAIKRLIQINTK